MICTTCSVHNFMFIQHDLFIIYWTKIVKHDKNKICLTLSSYQTSRSNNSQLSQRVSIPTVARTYCQTEVFICHLQPITKVSFPLSLFIQGFSILIINNIKKHQFYCCVIFLTIDIEHDSSIIDGLHGTRKYFNSNYM